MARLEPLAPSESWVFGKPTIPEGDGAADGQFRATNVCHAKFHQSFCEALAPLLTSAGTTQEFAGRAEVLSSVDAAGGAGFSLQPEVNTVQTNAENINWEPMARFCMVQIVAHVQIS